MSRDLVALVVNNPPANTGDARAMGSIPGSGRFPGEAMATHSGLLAWDIPWTEEPGGAPVHGGQKCRTRLSLHTHRSLKFNLFITYIKFISY